MNDSPFPRETPWIAAAMVVFVLFVAIYRLGQDDTTAWQDRVLDAYAERFDAFEPEPGFDTESFVLGGVNRACGLLTEDPDVPAAYQRLVDFGYSSDQSTFFIAAGTYYRCAELSHLTAAYDLGS